MAAAYRHRLPVAADVTWGRSGHAGQAAGMRQGTRALMDALDGPASDGGHG